ncbi:hypothetical protein EVAR_96680_1 [Eumeta japonica]|uniref:Uncharacterized protein n=1 Tax=Eumeta variegata TaxID=151549 RepID=A0A4C1WJZ3_EUMVA|nr:hypothetical protein EVAR_96680_1 [Eumeta japonica]
MTYRAPITSYLHRPSRHRDVSRSSTSPAYGHAGLDLEHDFERDLGISPSRYLQPRLWAMRPRQLATQCHSQDSAADSAAGVHPHSTTSPSTSRPTSPQDDDISVTASTSPPPDERPGAFTSVQRTRKPLQPLPAPTTLFHSALAAQLFLNSPLLPTPPAWLYSQLYGSYDWWLRPPPQREDSNSSPDREEEAGSTASGTGKKRPASPEWSDQGVRTRSKSLIAERRPVDVWRPY